MAQRSDIRNVGILAHIDHGKTTLLNAMLSQAGAFQAHQEVQDRVMDSMDQERERGITILAKNTAVQYGDTKINIVDTPGHADFGGEVERALHLVDGVLLLVDASEGPLPQTRFVLRKALEARLPMILVVNKIDRPDARIGEVVNETYDLLLDLDADEEQIEFPIIYTNAKAGTATLEEGKTGTNLHPLFEAIIESIPAPSFTLGHPLQAHVANLDSSEYLGRLALCRIHNGELRKGETVAWYKKDGKVESRKISGLQVAQGLNRVDADIVGAGDIAVVAGFEEITIGETLTDANDPRPLPLVIVDEPSLGVTIGVNTSPLAGKSGSKLTARQIKARLSQELIGNMAIKVLDRETPDTWEVQGRGEMQLAVLVESMRREGFELTVGKPQVVIKEIDGKRHEPIEHVSIDVPEDYLGVVTQLFALRKGRMEQMVNHGTGWVRLEYAIPARGLIGIRTEFLTETRGTGIMHHVFDHYGEWAGEMKLRSSGALVADRHGAAAPYALFKLQERGAMFVEPTNEVYEGMIVGENARAEDMDVNVTKGKELSNMRSSGADDFIKLVPALRFGLDQALEFIQDDECIEVTPDIIRLRKNILAVSPRAKAARQNKASS